MSKQLLALMLSTLPCPYYYSFREWKHYYINYINKSPAIMSVLCRIWLPSKKSQNGSTLVAQINLLSDLKGFSLRWGHLSSRILAHTTSHFYSSVGVPLTHEFLCKGTWILAPEVTQCAWIRRVIAFFGTNMQLQLNEIHLQPTSCSVATLTRQRCNPKSWGGVTLKPWGGPSSKPGWSQTATEMTFLALNQPNSDKKVVGWHNDFFMAGQADLSTSIQLSHLHSSHRLFFPLEVWLALNFF